MHNSLKTEDAKKHFEGKQVEEVVSLEGNACVSCFARSANPVYLRAQYPYLRFVQL